MAQTPVALVLAKARVRKDAQIEIMPSETVRVKPNQPVLVKFLFSLEETSRAKDEWEFLLTSNVGPQEKGMARSFWKDRWGIHDKGWGVLHHEYTFPAPGKYDGRFEVSAEVRQASWTDNQRLGETKCVQRGAIRIVVDKN